MCFLSNRTNFVQRQAFDRLLLASSGPKENVFHGKKILDLKKTLFNAVVIPSKLQHKILHAVHENLGHMGINKTYAFLRQRYFWPGMKKTNHKPYQDMYPVHTRELTSSTIHTWFSQSGETAHVSLVHGPNWSFAHLCRR